ncbi:transcriptional regulator, GntR family [Pseudomonas asplenii]|uniref:Transcriptional regulator, GntR family n=1 Tax=Pseudomonas asplenii TaxID=53407 RepID=A0A1H6P5U4_9PSED|nr:MULTISPECIES: FadR/GntR family transcriptional regulator [Pseudomonas]SDS98828.1 transcriptional regulator, GntR family [Pseudomonas asplenii]SEI23052.1 transcriptional regulator, GntR family [Pseudomonas fuscovaginae]
MSIDRDLSTPLRRKRTPNLATDLVNHLTQRIRLGELKPGEKLPSESAIIREHKVSRTVVREAISKLQAAGWVETHHGVGSFVLERQEGQGLRLSADTALSVRGILELRLGLETQAVALAARRRTDEHLRQMRETLDEYQSLLANNDSCVAADQRFHLLIAEATGNPYFVEILLHLGNSMIPRTQVQAAERGDTDLAPLGQLANQEHEAILAAIRRQDADAARAAMWTHLSNSQERFASE